MNDYKPTVGFEPTNDYLKAKQDLFNAMESFRKLSQSEREYLIREMFNVAQAEMLYGMIMNNR